MFYTGLTKLMDDPHLLCFDFLAEPLHPVLQFSSDPPPPISILHFSRVSHIYLNGIALMVHGLPDFCPRLSHETFQLLLSNHI